MFSTVGRLNTASPALPIEIRTSTKLMGKTPLVYPFFSDELEASLTERSTVPSRLFGWLSGTVVVLPLARRLG